jgi:hypothetical protein
VFDENDVLFLIGKTQYAHHCGAAKIVLLTPVQAA